VGETKRKLAVWVKEHRTETDKVGNERVYTRDKKKQSETEYWGSALTDQSIKENHVIDWDSANVVDK
jgi:hypothetical protein